MENTYHYSWTIYSQSTFGRIFLDSIDMLDLLYSWFFFIFVFVVFHILMEKRLTFSKKMKIYHDTKIPLIFFINESLSSIFQNRWQKWLVVIFFTLFGFKMSFCLKLWFFNELFRYLISFEDFQEDLRIFPSFKRLPKLWWNYMPAKIVCHLNTVSLLKSLVYIQL